MRRYTVNVNGTDHVIDVEEVTASTFRVELDGIAADVRLTDHQALSQAMITPQVEIGHAAPVAPPPVPATAPPRPVTATPSAPAPAVPASSGASPAAGTALTAPMPGVVLTVEVAPGNAVKRGDLLVVLEAMKMKNELRARADGVVASVPAQAGAQVAFGEPLVTFEG